MAGIVKNTKEDIVNAAFEIVKEKGIEGLNARNVAQKLNCSIQPIFYQFATMNELKQAVFEEIHEIYKDYREKFGKINDKLQNLLKYAQVEE